MPNLKNKKTTSKKKQNGGTTTTRPKPPPPKGPSPRQRQLMAMPNGFLWTNNGSNNAITMIRNPLNKPPPPPGVSPNKEKEARQTARLQEEQRIRNFFNLRPNNN